MVLDPYSQHPQLPRIAGSGELAYRALPCLKRGDLRIIAETRGSAECYHLSGQDKRIRADHRRVEDAIGDPACTIVDVRTDAEYRGERFWPSGGSEPGGRAGHIPSAVHLPIESVLSERGSFRTADELRELFSPGGPSGDGEIITYCTIGGRACTAWLALTYLLGFKHVAVYDGSWAEWGKLPATPVECS